MRVESMVSDEVLGGDAALWVYLDECTERASRVNPFVSTTSALSVALGYATEAPGSYLSVIAPQNDDYFRYVEFAPELHVGTGRHNQEVGMTGILMADEILAQIPVTRLNEDIKLILQNVDQFSEWILGDGKEFEYRQADTILSPILHCPNCRASFPIYFHRQLGADSNKLARFESVGRHSGGPYDDVLVLTRGAACRCSNCGQTWYAPHLDDVELITLDEPEFFEDTMTVTLENRYGSNIDVLWLWFSGDAPGTRWVRQFRLRERWAEIFYRTQGLAVDKIEDMLALVDKSIPPGYHRNWRFQRDPRGREVGVFGAFFTDGYTWIPLKRLKEATWDTRGINGI
jgi:hypothetical protein